MRVLPVVIGAIIAVMGVIFMLQGFGVLGGSPMTGSALWAVLGPIIALIGLGLVVYGVRGRRSS